MVVQLDGGVWVPSRAWRKTHKLAGDPLQTLEGAHVKALQELHRSLSAEGLFSNELHDLYMLRRFLKARDWDVVKARTMWTDMLAFRASNRVDTILHEFVFHERESVLSVYPHGLHKVDKDGHPVMVYKFGAVDLEALEKITSTQRLTQYHIQEYERIIHCVLPACSVLTGRHVEKVVTLVDVAGVKMRDIGRVLDLLSTYIKIDSNNYPETLSAMIIINAPMWFSGSFSIIKRMLSAETQKKIQILGSNYQQTLHAIIPPHNLLPDFGGTSTGRLADSVGPWTTVLEKLRQAEQAHAPAPLPAKVADVAAAAEGGITAAADVPARDDNAHVASAVARREAAVAAADRPTSAAGAAHLVLHPPKAPAAAAAAPMEVSKPHITGHKHALEQDQHTVVPAAPAAAQSPQAPVGAAPADGTAGIEVPAAETDVKHRDTRARPSGPGAGGAPHAADPQSPSQQPQHLDPIVESVASPSQCSNVSEPCLGAPLLQQARGPHGPGVSDMPHITPISLDSFYSVGDSATWTVASTPTTIQHHTLNTQHSLPSSIKSRAHQQTQAAGGTAQGPHAPQRSDGAGAHNAHADGRRSSAGGAGGGGALTEDRLRAVESYESNEQAALYRSLDTASVASFESCRSVESAAISTATATQSPAGRSRAVSRSNSRRLRAADAEAAAAGMRASQGRLPRWQSGSRGSHELARTSAPAASAAAPHTEAQPLPDWNGQWAEDQTDLQGGVVGHAMPPAAVTGGAGPRGLLPSFAAWGPNAPMMYQPAGAGAGLPQPPFLAPHDASIQARAAAQVNEYMRLWLQAAADMFHHATRAPHTSASRQQLLDPRDPTLSNTIGSGDLSAQLAAEAAAGGLRARADRIVAAAGQTHHKRTRSGTTLPLRPTNTPLSDSPVAPDTYPASPPPLSQAGQPFQPGVGVVVDGMTRGPSAAAAGGKLPKMSYDVYVDSEDEEAGTGLLRRNQPSVVLPRYGVVRSVLRRVFCGCCG